MVWECSFLYRRKERTVKRFREVHEKSEPRRLIALKSGRILSLKIKLQWSSREESQNFCALK